MLKSPVPIFRFITEADGERDDVKEFECGNERWDIPVAEFLRSGEALKRHRPPKQVTFLYLADGGYGRLIGYFNHVRKDRQISGHVVPSLHITWLGVAKDHQGSGYGHKMLEQIVNHAKSGGAGLVDLYVHSENEKAIRFYERNEFVYVAGGDNVEDSERFLFMARPI